VGLDVTFEKRFAFGSSAAGGAIVKEGTLSVCKVSALCLCIQEMACINVLSGGGGGGGAV